MKRILRDMNMDDKVSCQRPSRRRYKGLLVLPRRQGSPPRRALGDIRRIRTAKIYSLCQTPARTPELWTSTTHIYYTVRLLQGRAGCARILSEKFRYVLIDEYQDTNHLQYLFAALMASGSRNICVAATTTRASINSAARRSRISSPLKAVPDARVIRLEQNYRSTGNILAAANAVIANNRERKGKTLWTAQSGGDPVTLFEARNEDDEADFVARTIASAR